MIATMKAPINLNIAFGTLVEGGYYAGRIRTPEGDEYGILVAPKASGQHKGSAWNRSLKRVDGALSFYDGLANTRAMQEAGSKLAAWALGLQVNGFSDWYLPARDELELCYRHLKPGTETNWCYRGDNPSSVPPGYAYMPDAPAQTAIEEFRTGGTEAFDEVWYWTSTHYAGNDAYAWTQSFYYGGQYGIHKVDLNRARAVRRIKL